MMIGELSLFCASVPLLFIAGKRKNSLAIVTAICYDKVASKLQMNNLLLCIIWLVYGDSVFISR